MVSPIKQYAPLDMTDFNKIVNLGEPVDPHDAATKSIVDVVADDLEARVPSGVYGSVILSTGRLSNADSTGLKLMFTGPVETIFSGCDLKMGEVGATVPITIDLWTSQINSGTQKTLTVRLRRTNLAGAILKTWTIPATTDSADGHRNQITETYVDSSPTDGHYVLTGVENNAGNAVWSDTRVFMVGDPSPSTVPVGPEGSRLVVDSGLPAWAPEVGKIEIGIDGHGGLPQTGVRADLMIPYDLTITDWTVMADQSGDIQVDIWKSTLAAYPPVDAGSITGSDPPRLSSALTASSTALTGWSKVLAKGDCLRINLDSVATLTRATITLGFTKS